MGNDHKRVSISDIKTITLHEGRMTAARRTPAIPQLTCTGKLCDYAPQTVQCKNMGDDGTGVQWRCEADLPRGVAFGELDVSCEGWRGPMDKNVLAGSCALKYELVRARGWKGTLHEDDHTSSAGASAWIPLAVFLLIMAVMYWFSRRERNQPPVVPPGRGGWGGGGGGGGGGGDPRGPWSPPPPYSAHPKPDPDNSTATSSGPGFWTGLAAGAAGATAYNRFAGNRDRERELERQLEFERMQARERERARERTRAPPPPRWDDEPGPSRRAAGFGGTSTR